MGRRILVVEDSPTQAERLRLLLEGQGYQVDVAVNGLDALSLVRASSPDIIVSDVIMPDMDGYALCAAVKTDPRTKRIPFVLLTERKTPLDIIQGFERGADNFITKPFEDGYLLERVRRILEHLELRSKGQLEMEVSLRLGDRDITITPDKQQIIELLLSSFEELGCANANLRQREHDLETKTGELEVANRTLEAQIAERVKAQEALTRRTAQLEAANKELETFSYSVSHDLRAPLRAIDGFSRVLLEECAGQLGPGGQRYLHMVRDNTQRMGQLIDDLLSFSRLGRHALRMERVAPADVARQVLQELEADHVGRRVEQAVGEMPPCHADPAMLRQVFSNLLANALKFTRTRDPGRIEVGSRNTGDEVVYFVKDNGAGFDVRYAHKLFGVFQRLHSVEEYEGTGVGLAIVQRIIHRHGGRLWAEAEVDKGATFYFTLGGGGGDA